MSNNAITATAEVVPLKTMGTVGGKDSENRKASKPPMATPMTVTITICRIVAAATIGLPVPMAFKTPIWDTFCKIWI